MPAQHHFNLHGFSADNLPSIKLAAVLAMAALPDDFLRYLYRSYYATRRRSASARWRAQHGARFIHDARARSHQYPR